MPIKHDQNVRDDHAYSESWHSQNSLLKHFQGYLSIFRDINAYSLQQQSQALN